MRSRLSFSNIHKTVSLGSLLVLGLTACQGNSSNPPIATLPQTLAVSGRGMVDIPKTTSRVSLGIEIQQETSADVQRVIAEKSAAVVKLLKAKATVTKLETTNVTLSPRYQTRNGKPTIVGYTGLNTVRFQVAPDQIGQLLDEAIKVGATKVDGVTLVATDEAIATAQKAAIAQASKDAQAQAEASLSSLGLKQAAIVGIQINGASLPITNTPNQNLAQMQNMELAKSDSLPVVAGDQRIEAVVTLQVRYQ
jgi:uncharacterized protein